jgi:hypothetical protein
LGKKLRKNGKRTNTTAKPETRRTWVSPKIRRQRANNTTIVNFDILQNNAKNKTLLMSNPTILCFPLSIITVESDDLPGERLEIAVFCVSF